jgi:hypothetical protein
MKLPFGIILISAGIIPYIEAGKRALGLPWDSVASDLAQLPVGNQISACYNWECYRPPLPPNSPLEYVAMLRTAHPDDIQRFQLNMPTNGARTLLCLNECEIREQANLSPEQAAQIWRQYCWPQKNRGVRLGAPTITNAPQSIAWLQRFTELTRDVPADFQPIHWYGTDGNNMIQYIQSVRDHFQKPIWVTEFCHLKNNLWDQQGLQKQVRQWMDSQWFVEKYFWFGCSRGDQNNVNDAARLLDKNGHPTDLYYKYAFDP